MSAPATIAAILGAFVIGLLLGMPLAYALAKRRLARTLSSPLSGAAAPFLEGVPSRRSGLIPSGTPSKKGPTAAQAEPTKILEDVVPKKPKHAATHVITSVGEPDVGPDSAARKEFELRPQLSALAKGALVEASSLAHGLRSALTEENRAKIQYEIKRELIALRKTRKDEVKKALAEYRAKHRAPVQPDSGEGS